MLGGGLPTSLTSELQVFCGLLGGLGCIRCTRARLPNGRVLGCSGMWRAGLITRVSEVPGDGHSRALRGVCDRLLDVLL